MGRARGGGARGRRRVERGATTEFQRVRRFPAKINHPWQLSMSLPTTFFAFPIIRLSRESASKLKHKPPPVPRVQRRYSKRAG